MGQHPVRKVTEEDTIPCGLGKSEVHEGATQPGCTRPLWLQTFKEPLEWGEWPVDNACTKLEKGLRFPRKC